MRIPREFIAVCEYTLGMAFTGNKNRMILTRSRPGVIGSCSELFCFGVFVEDEDGPKMKQAKTRNIFCLFVHCFCRCCFLLGLR